jgi:hypothetical protein
VCRVNSSNAHHCIKCIRRAQHSQLCLSQLRLYQEFSRRELHSQAATAALAGAFSASPPSQLCHQLLPLQHLRTPISHGHARARLPRASPLALSSPAELLPRQAASPSPSSSPPQHVAPLMTSLHIDSAHASSALNQSCPWKAIIHVTLTVKRTTAIATTLVVHWYSNVIQDIVTVTYKAP